MAEPVGLTNEEADDLCKPIDPETKVGNFTCDHNRNE